MDESASLAIREQIAIITDHVDIEALTRPERSKRIGTVHDLRAEAAQWQEYAVAFATTPEGTTAEPHHATVSPCFRYPPAADRGHWLTEGWIGRRVMRTGPPEGAGRDVSFTDAPHVLVARSHGAWMLRDPAGGVHAVSGIMDDDRWRALETEPLLIEAFVLAAQGPVPFARIYEPLPMAPSLRDPLRARLQEAEDRMASYDGRPGMRVHIDEMQRSGKMVRVAVRRV
jgi:hypothetical protein